VILKSTLGVTHGYWKWHHLILIDGIQVPIRLSCTYYYYNKIVHVVQQNSKKEKKEEIKNNQ